MTGNRRAAIRAITFDAAGTLLEPWPSVGHGYASAIDDAGLGALDPAELNRRFFQAWTDRGAFDFSRAAWARLVAVTLDGLVARADDPLLLDALWQHFTRPESWRIFDDVHPCLDALTARGWRMAVVSNWDERLHALLHDTGLAHHFEFILPSVEAPAPKPDPRIFAAAARRLDLPPSALLHVGDREREDLEGAWSAGFHAVLVDRQAGPSSANRIRSLIELPARVSGD